MGCTKSKAEQPVRTDSDAVGTIGTKETPNLNIQSNNAGVNCDQLSCINTQFKKRFSTGDFIKKKNALFYDDYIYVKDLGKGPIPLILAD